nr:Maf family protein [Pseudenhygromyxa sp. WMMC2535]
MILASASPRRAELLTMAGLRFEQQPVDCDERWRPGEAPVDYARRVASAKLELAVAKLELERAFASGSTSASTSASGPTEVPLVLLSADTTVWLDVARAPLGKPRDRDDARAMLRELCAGRPHEVTTACAIARRDPGRPELWRRELVETTTVHMRELVGPAFDEFIEPHLDAGEWTDKAGGYAIQGRAAALVTRIDGSYTSVVGLPLAQVVDALAQEPTQ